jgi:methionyl-tRNA formyltransferase
LLSWKRVQHEWHRDGFRLAKKVWKKLVLKERSLGARKVATLRDTASSLDVEHHTVPSYCKQNGIPLLFAADLNGSKSVTFVKSHTPDMILFTGGGLLREELLDLAPLGVLNCHAGYLPEYRGMDVVEWAALENSPNKLGQTVHLMDLGVDTGPILKWFPASIERGDTFQSLRSKLMARAPYILVDTAKQYAEKDIEAKPQQQGDGRQYFILHPRLQQIADMKIAKLTE